MADITHIFNGGFRVEDKILDSPETQLKKAIENQGLTPPDEIIFDGQLHRFNSGTQKKSFRKDDSGFYVAYGDGIPAGLFGCWRSDIRETWRADVGREITPAERDAQNRRIAEAKRKREEQAALRQANAALEAQEIWEAAPEASPDHPYLKKKGIGSHGLRLAPDGRLIAPLYDDALNLCTVQYIGHDGEKRYYPGGITKNRYCVIGDFQGQGTLYIAEGFATAATIHEQTQQPCVVAYSAGNLEGVTGIFREIYGNLQDIAIVADNDDSGIGQRHAEQASAKHGARVIVTPEPGDANDYYQAGKDLKALLEPPTPSNWLVSADDWAKEPAPIRWLIKGWIEQESLVMVHGASGNGKTFVVMDICLSLAAGLTEWVGHKINPTSVVYLAGEGHHGLRSRIAAWKQKRNVAFTNMHLSMSACDLNTAEGIKLIVDNVRQLPEPPGLIVVDTVHRHLKGNENSAEDVKTMLDACAYLKEQFGATVLLVHHTGNNEDAQTRARGSSAWRGALETEISVTADPMKLVQMKSKNSEMLPPLYCELQNVAIDGWFDEDGEPVSSLVFEPKDGPPENVKTDEKQSKAKLSDMAMKGMKAFNNACVEKGRKDENGEFAGVSDLFWRDSFYEFCGDSYSNKRQAFSRVKTNLLELGLIFESEGYYYPDIENPHYIIFNQGCQL